VLNIIGGFLSRVQAPPHTHVDRPFLLGVIGNLGSGKSTVAQLLTLHLRGSVVVSANSARYLLKQRGLPWGDNVRHVVREVAHDLLFIGRIVILDGSNADPDERHRNKALGELMGIPVRYIRLKTPYELCRTREQVKYDDQTWISSFEQFRVGSTDRMLLNLDKRRKLHDALRDEDIEGLVGSLTNAGTLEDLESEVRALAPKILASL